MRRTHAIVALPTVICLLSVGRLVSAPHSVLLSVIRGVDGRPVPCREDPVCHNRIHPGIPPAAFANPGDVVTFETRDAADNQLNSTSTAGDVATGDLGRIHPLTGPLFVNGAQPGDVLEVTIGGVDPGPDRFGWTAATPLLGFLRDLIPGPALARWDLQPRGAVSPDLPGVRIPEAAFPGVVTTAPGPALLGEILSREFEALLAGGMALPPDPSGAVPEAVCGASSTAAMQCLRTLPAREHGGNFDVKALRPGVKLLLPCFVEGCLLSIGDVHYAQGDGEVAGSAIEMNAIVRVGIRLRKGQATELGNRPAFASGPPFGSGPPAERRAASDGPHLTSTRGLTEEQAYLLASVAVDLRIGNVVDVPNVTVYAMLPLDVFTSPRKHPET